MPIEVMFALATLFSVILIAFAWSTYTYSAHKTAHKLLATQILLLVITVTWAYLAYNSTRVINNETIVKASKLNDNNYYFVYKEKTYNANKFFGDVAPDTEIKVTEFHKFYYGLDIYGPDLQGNPTNLEFHAIQNPSQ